MTLAIQSPVQSFPDLATPNPSVSTQKTAATSSGTEDKVELSAAAQVKLLYQEGNSVSAIASSLSLPTKTVDSYLDITATAEAALLSAELKKG
jgi:hypothetical protein